MIVFWTGGLSGGEASLVTQRDRRPDRNSFSAASLQPRSLSTLDASAGPCLALPPLWPVPFQQRLLSGLSKHVSVHGGAECNRLLEFHHRVCHFMTEIGIAPLENSAIGTALPKRALGSNSFTWQWFLLRKVQVDSCYFHKSSCLRNVILDIPF